MNITSAIHLSNIYFIINLLVISYYNLEQQWIYFRLHTLWMLDIWYFHVGFRQRNESTAITFKDLSSSQILSAWYYRKKWKLFVQWHVGNFYRYVPFQWATQLAIVFYVLFYWVNKLHSKRSSSIIEIRTSFVPNIDGKFGVHFLLVINNNVKEKFGYWF